MCTAADAHHALVDRVRALVRVHVARDHNVHAVLVEQVLQVLLEVDRQPPRALGRVVRLVEAHYKPSTHHEAPARRHFIMTSRNYTHSQCAGSGMVRGLEICITEPRQKDRKPAAVATPG